MVCNSHSLLSMIHTAAILLNFNVCYALYHDWKALKVFLMRSDDHCLCIVASTDFTWTLTFTKNTKWLASLQEDLWSILSKEVLYHGNIAWSYCIFFLCFICFFIPLPFLRSEIFEFERRSTGVVCIRTIGYSILWVRIKNDKAFSGTILWT